MKPLFVVAALLTAAPALAQAPAPAAAPSSADAIDPARLAAARRVVAQVFPPAQRRQMVAMMVDSISGTMEKSLFDQPDTARVVRTDPRARPIFERFLRQQREQNIARMQANLPGMIDAIARAYARRFTTAQLAELGAFFETPTGQAYVAQSMTIMSDPDVAAWQGRLMTESMAAVRPAVRQLIQELKALAPAGKAQ